MEEKNVVATDNEQQKKKRSKLETALFLYRRQKAAEEKIRELEEKEKKAEAERKQRRKEKQEKQKAVDKAKKELAAVRAFAEVKKEPSNIRKQFAVKGFFDLMDKCNVTDRDFTDAYNFIGDTKWLLEALMKNVKVNTETNKLEIDISGMRNIVFAKKAEIENIIEDFKNQLDAEWKKFEELKKSESAKAVDEETAEPDKKE